MRYLTLIILAFISNCAVSQDYPVFNKLFSEALRTINDPVIAVDSAYGLDYNGGEWVFRRILRVSERDEYGHLFTANVDCYEGNEIEYTERWTASYFNNNGLTSFLTERWNQDSINWYMVSKQSWDDSLRLVENKSIFWLFGLPQYCMGQGDVYQYDSNGNLFENKLQHCGWQQIWDDSQRKLYQFDSLNFLVEYEWDDWDHDSCKWMGKTKWEYYYENNINTLSYIYQKFDGDTNWIKTWRRENMYDSNNVLNEVRYLLPINDSTYQLHQRWYYTYNQLGKILTETYENYDTTENQWFSTYKHTNEYINDTIIICHTRIKWDGEQGYWKNVWRTVWEYNEDFQLIYRLYQNGDSISWKNDGQDFFSYDEYGRLIRFENQDWRHYNEWYWKPIYCEEYFWPMYTFIDNTSENSEFLIYPNPGNETINIVFNDSYPYHYSIFSLNGKKVKAGILTSDNTEIIIREFTAGTYLIKTKSGTKEFIGKFIKVD